MKKRIFTRIIEASTDVNRKGVRTITNNIIVPNQLGIKNRQKVQNFTS